MFGVKSTVSSNSIAFVSSGSLSAGVPQTYGLKKRLEGVKNTRRVSKKDMKLNSFLPRITVDPETYEVAVDGKVLKMTPAQTVPMGQQAYMF